MKRKESINMIFSSSRPTPEEPPLMVEQQELGVIGQASTLTQPVNSHELPQV
jgi:hypothetical protein